VAHTNEAIFRKALEHLNETGEPDFDLYASDVVWLTRPDGPAHNEYVGHDGLREGNRSLRGVWAEIRGELLETTSQGDAVIGVIQWQLRSHQGVELEVVEAWVDWFRDGRIARVEQHGTEAEALAAVHVR
jgi:ketosteroid isomerase-like protein